MIKIALARLLQGHRTMKFPDGPPPAMPDRFRGRSVIDTSKCPDGCRACADVCPTGAIDYAESVRIDLGKCMFCAECSQACPQGSIVFTGDYRLAVRQRQALVIEQGRQEMELAVALDEKMKKLFGRSLKLRLVSAGGCNACEADVNVLTTLVWDLGRFGIQFVASPRHADGLLITGPVTKNMELALKKTWEAIPEPKIVIAVGSCAIAGGPYIGHDEVLNGAQSVVPVDLFIPGCPPHPLTILDGMLRLLGRMDRNIKGKRGIFVHAMEHRLFVKTKERLRLWHQVFKKALWEYEKKNIQEWQYWGNKRAERESRSLGLFWKTLNPKKKKRINASKKKPG